MFEFTKSTDSVLRAPRPLVASLGAHALGLLLLVALRDLAGLSTGPAVPSHVAILALRRRDPVRMPPGGHRSRISSRQFHPSPIPSPVRDRLSIATIAAPKVEIAEPSLAELPRITAEATKIATPLAPELAPVPKAVLKVSGFESSNALAAPISRAKAMTIGSFESRASTYTPQATMHPVRASGFSSEGLSPEASSTSAAPKRVLASGFGDSTIENNPIARKQAVANRFAPVEILSKPRPAYTAEARENKIEGEVLIEMEFRASGEARVLRLVRGLGYGLDENAAAAARGIRFRPAMRDGATVDSAAVVHILFQLAQ